MSVTVKLPCEPLTQPKSINSAGTYTDTVLAEIAAA